jgi:hypothetical protein
MDAQHDANDRTDVGLIVNNKHAGHRSLPDRSCSSLRRKFAGFSGSTDIIQPVGKEAVTRLSSSRPYIVR